MLAGAACHHAASGDENDAGDDGDGACSCGIATNTGEVSIACAATQCVGDTVYLCSDGTPLITGTCGDGGGELPDSATDGPDASMGCVTGCNGVQCGEPDPSGCGVTCGCANGVACSGGMCGNGCSALAGSPCFAGNEDPQTCCQQGNQCIVKDSGASVCCAQTSTASFVGGLCQTSADCCDYPTVQCNPGTGTCQ